MVCAALAKRRFLQTYIFSTQILLEFSGIQSMHVPKYKYG